MRERGNNMGMDEPKCWWLRVWRFAWARTHYEAIGGWRRLWWRLWWRRPVPVLPPAPTVLLVPPIHKPPKILHLVMAPENVPVCGASIREPWTEEIQFATCPACKEAADARWLQWRVSTR